jgi:hypothetical protein
MTVTRIIEVMVSMPIKICPFVPEIADHLERANIAFKSSHADD